MNNNDDILGNKPRRLARFIRVFVCLFFSSLAIPIAIVVFVSPPQFLFSTHLQAEVFHSKGLPYLESNDLLRNIKTLFKDEILGPESIAIDEETNWIYTGLMDGRIIRFQLNRDNISETKFENFVRIKSDARCKDVNPKRDGGYDEYDPDLEPICGRVLGMKLRGNTLYACESYSGVYSIDLSTRKVELLTSGEWTITLANDLDITKDGKKLYFTDSSNRWGRNKIIYEVLALKTNVGRVFEIDLLTKRMKLIAKDLPMTNGLTLSHDGASLYFVCGGVNVYRMEGLREGKYDLTLVLNNLPAVGDNIRRHPNGRTYLLVGGVKRSQPFSLLDALALHPNVRNWIYHLIPQKIIIQLMPAMVLVMELALDDKQAGELVRTWQTRKLKFTSEVEVVKKNKVALLGTWHENWLAYIEDFT